MRKSFKTSFRDLLVAASLKRIEGMHFKYWSDSLSAIFWSRPH